MLMMLAVDIVELLFNNGSWAWTQQTHTFFDFLRLMSLLFAGSQILTMCV